MDSETESAEERLTSFHKLYQALARDYKRVERRLVECQRKQLEVREEQTRVAMWPSDLCTLQVAQHRDIIQTEHARVNLAKTKLENLCRELQRHNKAVVVCLMIVGVVFWQPQMFYSILRRRVANGNAKMRRGEERCQGNFRLPSMTSHWKCKNNTRRTKP